MRRSACATTSATRTSVTDMRDTPMSGEETLFLGIRSATLGASLLMVAFVATTHVALKWWTRRRYRREVARSDDHPGEERGIAHWVASSLLDLVAPVARTSRRPVRAHHRHGDPSAAVPAAAVSRGLPRLRVMQDATDPRPVPTPV